MVQDEPRDSDRLYQVGDLYFMMDQEEEKYVSYLEIDFEENWWGADFIITAGF
ncbi:Fe-S cluster assembly iron-binding protein IscA [Anaerosolibacter carboniphilus]|uniref:Fe-S cluster assembly iron-binding protein IscA n=1 Tax=Anaerosolibacter carboniphilus TaxID=1417629 RepID=A0A841KTK5_9FIRM|nr:hypothetical protein [Anaerosolibacter carboniphilus]MBB6216747.1 Fe-S cluster assembly iron-binding protein IscA [Anaerosolibacter carboniphilus]